MTNCVVSLILRNLILTRGLANKIMLTNPGEILARILAHQRNLLFLVDNWLEFTVTRFVFNKLKSFYLINVCRFFLRLNSIGLCRLLSFKESNLQLINDVPCVVRVFMRSCICLQSVSTVEEFADISSNLLLNQVSSTWMVIDKINKIDHSIVKKNKLSALGNKLVKLDKRHLPDRIISKDTG